MIKAKTIPIALCKKRLRYENGKLFWRDGQRKGKEVGSLTDYGYKRVVLDGEKYLAHRIIYSLFNGKITDGLVIDHKNQKRGDNHIKNLRAVSYLENNKNTGLRSNNASGVSGVCWRKSRQKYEVRISVNKKRIHLGYFADINEGKKARLAAEIKYANVKPITPTFSECKVKKINIKELREQFDYNDGFLVRKTGANAGKPITGGKGVYSEICFNVKMYAAHRLIYAWHNGEIGKSLLIDHIDRNKKNNKIENLRAVSASENSQNRKKPVNNTSGCVA